MEREEKIKELKYQLDLLDNESLESLFTKFNVYSGLSKENKKKALLSRDIDLVLKEAKNLKSVHLKEMELKNVLNSLTDEEINVLFSKFYDFGDFLKREDKIYSLSKCDKEAIFKEINDFK